MKESLRERGFVDVVEVEEGWWVIIGGGCIVCVVSSLYDLGERDLKSIYRCELYAYVRGDV